MARVGHAVRVVTGLPRALGRAAWRRPVPVFAVWGLVLALLLVASVVMWRGDRDHDQVEAGRAAAEQSARDQVVSMLTYDFRSIDEDLARAQQSLTGELADEYRGLSRAQIAPNALRDEIVTTARVIESSVVHAAADRVVVLTFVDVQTRSRPVPGPNRDISRLRLTMDRVDDRWLMSQMLPV